MVSTVTVLMDEVSYFPEHHQRMSFSSSIIIARLCQHHRKNPDDKIRTNTGKGPKKKNKKKIKSMKTGRNVETNSRSAEKVHSEQSTDSVRL